MWEKAVFNSRRQVTELNLGHGLNGDLWKLGYEYGELRSDGTVDVLKNTGNIARQTVSFSGMPQPFVQSYRYDSLYRITEAKETSGSAQNWIQNWEYDRYGNRTGFTQDIAGVATAPNPSVDALTNRFAAGQGFVYDKNGNVVQDVDPVTTQMREFVFNGDNKQTEVRDANGVVIAKYSYDGEGKRVKKEVIATGETTVFVYSSGKLVAEYSNATPPASPQVSYTTTDHLGSPRVITNALGQVTSRRDFLPFGEEITQNVGSRTASLGYGTSDTIRQKFTGYQKDSETSLDFAEARMYANTFGRFTAVDPLLASGKSANPQSFNRYAYVLNSPLIFVDANGLYPVYWDGKNLFSRTQYKGMYRYDGPKIVITGSNGYYYTITKEEMTRGKRWRKTERTLERKTVGAKLPEEVKSPPTPFINRKLIDALADEGAKKQTILFTAVGIGAGAGACVALCPSAIVGTASIAGSGGTTGLGTGLGTFTFTFAVGVGAEHLVNGSGRDSLNEQLSTKLAEIYTKYPACSFQCEEAARETNTAFQEAGIASEILQFSTGTPYVMTRDGRTIGEGFHQVVRAGNLYYDAVTGPTGVTWEEYTRLFEGTVQLESVRPYYPPDDEP